MTIQARYTDAERTEAVAAVLGGATLAAASAATGVPVSTLGDWVQAAREAEAEALGKPRETHNYDHAALWGNASALASRLIGQQLQRYEDEGRDLSPGDLQRVAIVGGISTDKHLDYRDGRKGAISIDNRSVNVSLDANQAAALLAAAQRAAAALPAGESPQQAALPEGSSPSQPAS